MDDSVNNGNVKLYAAFIKILPTLHFISPPNQCFYVRYRHMYRISMEPAYNTRKWNNKKKKEKGRNGYSLNGVLRMTVEQIGS